MKTFGKIISERRKTLGLSQKELATRIKKDDGVAISAQYLNDIEHDRRNPPSEFMIEQLAQELNFEKDFLCLVAGTVPQDIHDALLEARPQEVERVVRVFRRRINK